MESRLRLSLEAHQHECQWEGEGLYASYISAIVRGRPTLCRSFVHPYVLPLRPYKSARCHAQERVETAELLMLGLGFLTDQGLMLIKAPQDHLKAL